MSKILIVLGADTYLRNYLTTDAFSSLERDFVCHFLVLDTVQTTRELKEKKGFIGSYSVDGKLWRKYRLLSNLLMWRHRKRSRTFFLRWLRNTQWHGLETSVGIFRRSLSIVRWILSAALNPEGLIIPFLGNRVTFPLSSRIIKSLIPPNRELEALISSEKYAAVVFPSIAFDTLAVDIPRACAKLGPQSICLIDNWDNLSSKTVFWSKPDDLGVWGPQAAEQARTIHGFQSSRIHEIGTPRFEQYFQSRVSKDSASLHDFPYLLFVGSAMPFDELSVLSAIDALLTNHEIFDPRLRVIYRPHPWQQKRQVASLFRQEDFEKVLLDQQLQLEFSRNSGGGNRLSFQPALNYYPKLLLNASCVIGPLTTMLLEASLCLRPVVALNYSDRIHMNTNQRYFSHFDGAESIPGFSFCNSENDLGRLIEAAISMGPISPETSDSATSYFLHRSEVPYPDRLLQVVRKSLSRAEKGMNPSLHPDKA